MQHLKDLYHQHPTLSVGAVSALAFTVLVGLGRKYFLGPKVPTEYLKNKDLTNKIVIITGVAPNGIGYYTAEQLLSLGATVVLAVRNVKQGELTKQELIKSTKRENVNVMELDLSNLESVVKFVNEFKQKYNECHYLINNAGIMWHPHDVTKQGIEIQFGTNHIGHFLLTNLLLNTLKKSNARIINVSSLGHTFVSKETDVTGNGYSSYTSIDQVKGECKEQSTFNLYSRSKLANVLFSKKLNRLLMNDESGTKARAYSLHPGSVNTNLTRYAPGWLLYFVRPLVLYFCKTPLYGAQTSLYCALAPDEVLTPGAYYSDCKLKESTKFSNREELQDRLWDISTELCKSYL
ncbi:hypothetical protein ABK040_014527 [Willaertia magna]